jgi:large subunit ribosomal protein L5
MNTMRNIKIEKIVLNMGCGTKTKLDDAKKIMEKVAETPVVITKTKKRSTFGVPKNKEIGCKVTLRKNTTEFLQKLFVAKESISESSFDNTGNLSFGIKEYIDVPGIEYDPKIGVLGFDVCVTLERPGYRVKKKRLGVKIGKKHKIQKNEAIDFIKNNFKIKISE